MLVGVGVAVAQTAPTDSKPGEFALRDGDTVAFLGDSITAAQTYGKIIEEYTLLRYPERKIRFFNAGWGGDTAEGGLKRLQRDVIDRGATVVTVAYGVNDIGWGLWADEQHKQIYLDSIRGIVEACKAKGIRVYICSAAATGANPSKAEGDFLQTMCDEGMAISRSMGEGSIDVLGAMRDIQKKIWKVNEATTDTKKKPITLHAADTVHLNDSGHIAMAYVILKGLGAPADVSSVTLSATDPKSVVAQGCTVSEVKVSPSKVEFVRLDQGLPLTLGLGGHVVFWFVPIPNELARYMLRITDLAPGKYEVKAEDRLVGTYSNERLAEGVNIGNATPSGWIPGGPWDSQSTAVRSLTDGRYKITDNQRDLTHFYPAHPEFAELQKSGSDLVAEIEKLQKETARPVPYHFVVSPVEP